MKTMIAAFAALCYLTIQASAQVINLDDKSGAKCVWVNSSAPPAAPNDATVKPEWSRPSAETDDKKGPNLGPKPLAPINNVWYPLGERIKDMRVGGWGDEYVGFLNCPVPDVLAAKKVTLRVYLEAEAGTKMPATLEVRGVASADPLPIKKKQGESWSPERIRFSNQPSSMFVKEVEVKAGWVEVDVKVWLQAMQALNRPIHGFRFSDNDGHHERFVRIHGPSSKNPPQLVLEK